MYLRQKGKKFIEIKQKLINIYKHLSTLHAILIHSGCSVSRSLWLLNISHRGWLLNVSGSHRRLKESVRNSKEKVN